MIRTLGACAAVALAAVVAVPEPASAHHSGAMFDHTREIDLAGTVKDFRFANPHSWIYLLVKDSKGQENVYELEGGSISILARNGWNSRVLHVGDKISVKAFPRKDNTMAGEFHVVTLADGKTLGNTPQY